MKERKKNPSSQTINKKENSMTVTKTYFNEFSKIMLANNAFFKNSNDWCIYEDGVFDFIPTPGEISNIGYKCTYYNMLYRILSELNDKRLFDIVEVFDRLYRYPFFMSIGGGTIHHDYTGGLINHSASVFSIAANVCDQYGQWVSKDITMIGALLHDIGKMYNVSNDRNIELDNECGTEGDFNKYMFGHVIHGHKLFNHIISLIPPNDLPNAIAVSEIEHILVSHHGHKHWGAAVEPRTIEAHIVHYADMIDSRINIFADAVTKHETESASYSQKMYGECGNGIEFSVPLFTDDNNNLGHKLCTLRHFSGKKEDISNEQK